MTQYLSNKIKILSFFLIIFVLYIHSGFHANEIDGMYWNHFIQEFISVKVGRLAVPLFFMISGYLFFLNTDSGILSIKNKMMSRVHSILIPYIYGCIFFVMFLLLIQFIPGVANFMNGDILPLFNKSMLNILKSVFWISDGGNTPLAFQLWFLRDLIIIIALTPLLYYFLRLLKWWALPLLFALSYLSITPESFLSSLFWFTLGGIFVFTKTSIEYRKSKWGLIILFLYLIVSLYEQIIGGGSYFESLQKVLILLGIVGIWFCYDTLVCNNFSLKDTKWLSIACSFTLFIYLFHEPTLNIVRKLIVIGIGKSSAGYLISYLISPYLLVFCAIVVGVILKRTIPRIYSNLVGGRI